ncbi:hypothetical protein GRI75_05640 [Altererythrobacter soli]|uniref:DUF8021 domain-containing protein n=1 Tax=Croceibacterium soli TaxID=1739690 RepID=A0A6I4UUH3_9SPHN|nr:hypothetical protein [Croceibacterium soli]MXP41127.1 hypothetical protein [Croceibacterium soli]
MLVKSIVATLLLATAAPAVAQMKPVQVPCERSCMEDIAGSFLEALAARDSSRLPLAADARYTENGQEMGFDNGLWRTGSAIGAYRHVFADPASGQLGLFATMDENGHGVTMGVRIRLELGQISEVELVTYRVGAGPAWNDAGYAQLEGMRTPKTLWTATVPAAQRKSRQELVQIANQYFEAIENNDGKGDYPFTQDCDRLENGTYTTNRPGMIQMGGVDIGAMGCKEQFSTGLYGVVTEVHSRRFPVIDEERQAVFAFGVFDHCGCKRSLTMPDGRVVEIAGFNRPSSILLAEAFKIQGNLIQQVEAVGTSVPYHSDPGWGSR